MIEVIDLRQPGIAAQLYVLQQAAYTLESQLIDYPALPPLDETVSDLEDSLETFLAYLNDNHPVGVLSFKQTGSIVEISRLVVNPQHLRQGIARSLLAALEQQVRPECILLVTTAEKNFPAIKLYESHGFRLSERWVLPDDLGLVRFRKQVR